LWVRNVHEKSSKTSLKALFGKLLDSLQEGSGLGVEFVDYEKGLETVRFSLSLSLSLLFLLFFDTDVRFVGRGIISVIFDSLLPPYQR